MDQSLTHLEMGESHRTLARCMEEADLDSCLDEESSRLNKLRKTKRPYGKRPKGRILLSRMIVLG